MLLCFHVFAHRCSSYTWLHVLSVFAALKNDCILLRSRTRQDIQPATVNLIQVILSRALYRDANQIHCPRRLFATFIHYAMSYGKGKAKASVYQQSQAASLIPLAHILTICLHREFRLDPCAPRYRNLHTSKELT